MASRARYTEDFRRQAVATALGSQRPVSHVAADLGVSPDTLRRWVRLHRAETMDTDPAERHTEPADEHAVPRPAPETSHHVAQDIGSPSAPRTNPSLSTALADFASTSADRVVAHLAPEPDDLFEALTRLPLRLRMLVVLFAWTCSVVASTLVSAPASVRAGAVVVHVLSLVIAFGAVVVVDWHGLLWLLGRRTLHESTRLASAAGPLIWVGLVGLLASGPLLRPDLGNPMTWTKLILVLALGINGVLTSTTARLLRDLPRAVIPASLPRQLQAQVVATTAVSQIGWWGAITIGFVTAIRGA